MNVAVGAGLHATHAEAQARMSRAGAFLPRARNAELYSRLYSAVYVRMYPRLARLYQSIRHITNYPRLDLTAPSRFTTFSPGAVP